MCVLQSAMVDDNALKRITSGNTNIEIYANMFKEYADRIVFGYCPPGEHNFVTLTYGQAWQRLEVRLH